MFLVDIGKKKMLIINCRHIFNVALKISWYDRIKDPVATIYESSTKNFRAKNFVRKIRQIEMIYKTK